MHWQTAYVSPNEGLQHAHGIYIVFYGTFHTWVWLHNDVLCSWGRAVVDGL